MRAKTIKHTTIAAILGSVSFFASVARADDSTDLKDALTTLQTDLKEIASVLASPPAAPPDMVKCGADLSSLGSYLRSIAADLTNAAQLTIDISDLKAAVTSFDTAVGKFTQGKVADSSALTTVGENFKATSDNLETILAKNLKQGNTISTDPAGLGGNLRVLAKNLENLGPNLKSAAIDKIPNLTGHGTNNSWGSLFLWAGARLENPYSIAVSNNVGTLKSGNKTTDGFVDFEVNLRYVFRNGDYEDEYWLDNAARHEKREANYYYPLALAPDIDFSLGYVFTASSAPSNYSTSTIAGGGDISLNTSLGIPLLRYKPTFHSDTNVLKLQITAPEIGGGVVTDKSFLVAHPTFFIGAGFQLAAPAKNFYWTGRLGIGIVDQPRIKSGSTVFLNGMGNPEFKWKGAPALGSGIIYKITDAIAAQLGANVYLTQVASWNISAAVSIDPTKFFQSLK